MRIIRNLSECQNLSDKLVVAFGNFDGVHLGHKQLIQLLIEKARNIGSLAAVFTFSPHPLQVLKPEQKLQLLIPPEDKETLLAELGIDILFSIPFTKELAKVEAETFVQEVIVSRLKAKGVVVGYNFSFGHRGLGNVGFLEQAGTNYGFFVGVLPPVYHDGQKVSSTLVRHLLQEGRVKEAAKCLGYLPYLKGEVVYGEGRGRKIGFPTANLELPSDILVPITGVYVVKVTTKQGEVHGIANIGYKPTFSRKNEKNIEVHLFDYHGNLYDSEIKVEFLDFVRPEKTFGSADELVVQINKDIALAKDFFHRSIS